MSAADQHRIKAEAALRRLPDEEIGITSAGAEATAYALLAIEARLGELVEAQRAAVRNVLGLDTVAEATEWGGKR
ncbi:hypothetical protein C5E45_32840 [Nocardia nova]|uniref:Uncharacterized protein n=1 Tax=Nocardia nova TaxID=37330 RepID=A0A2S6ACW0_9NOCA|nr:hypothetical protein [Nocardia nova]PPJ31879.1 hypothetical protein C5E45_32840 [Nocardia nova]